MLIFDVGANIGQTTARFREKFPCADIYSFEPFPNAYKQLNDRFHLDQKVHTYRLACSDKCAEVEFFVSTQDVLNSLLPPVDSTARGFTPKRTPVRVMTTTIDEFCLERGIGKIDILKIDVQGAEKLVFSGASRMLDAGRISLVLTEIQFFPFYKNQSWYYDVFQYLAAKEYRLFDIYNMVYGKNGHIRWADAIFLGPDLAHF